MAWYSVSVIRADGFTKSVYTGLSREQATTCYNANQVSDDCLVGILFMDEDGMKTILASFNRVTFDAA